MQEPTIKTSCRDCIFAEFDKGHGEKIQIDCKLGRLETFIDRDEAKYEQESDCGYYIIQRFCNTCRNHKWLEDNPGKDKTIMADTAINYGVVIHLDEPFNFLDIQFTINCIINQIYLPTAIHIIFDKYEVPKEQYTVLRALSQIPITFTKVLNNQLIKTGATLCDNQFFVVVKAGQFVPCALSDKFNKALNIDMKTFLIGKYQNTTIISRLAYDMLKSENIEESIRKLAPNMILEL